MWRRPPEVFFSAIYELVRPSLVKVHTNMRRSCILVILCQGAGGGLVGDISSPFNRKLKNGHSFGGPILIQSKQMFNIL